MYRTMVPYCSLTKGMLTRPTSHRFPAGFGIGLRYLISMKVLIYSYELSSRRWNIRVSSQKLSNWSSSEWNSTMPRPMRMKEYCLNQWTPRVSLQDHLITWDSLTARRERLWEKQVAMQCLALRIMKIMHSKRRKRCLMVGRESKPLSRIISSLLNLRITKKN